MKAIQLYNEHISGFVVHGAPNLTAEVTLIYIPKVNQATLHVCVKAPWGTVYEIAKLLTASLLLSGGITPDVLQRAAIAYADETKVWLRKDEVIAVSADQVNNRCTRREMIDVLKSVPFVVGEVLQ